MFYLNKIESILVVTLEAAEDRFKHLEIPIRSGKWFLLKIASVNRLRKVFAG